MMRVIAGLVAWMYINLFSAVGLDRVTGRFNLELVLWIMRNKGFQALRGV